MLKCKTLFFSNTVRLTREGVDGGIESILGALGGDECMVCCGWINLTFFYQQDGCLWASLYPLSVLKDREPCANAATNHVSSRCRAAPFVGTTGWHLFIQKCGICVCSVEKRPPDSNVCCLWKMRIARSLIHTVCEWKCVSVRNCGGAVQLALAGFQRLPPALLHRKKRWRNSGFCTSSPVSTTAGLPRWCCR